MSGRTHQSPSVVIMVRPENFGYNAETAETNAFQHKAELAESDLKEKVLQEFDNAVLAIRQAGVQVTVFQDRKQPICPDAIFPNNWFSVHQREGFIFLYPMLNLSRRLEIRKDVIDYVQTLGKFDVVDLSGLSEQLQFLEGTGSVVFDHVKHVAYACRSPRTQESVLNLVCERLGYRSVCFDATDSTGKLIYHTNVMMWVGTKATAICLESITNQQEADEVLRSLKDSGRVLLFLSQDEIAGFAGNCIELTNNEGDLILVMSSTAKLALSPANQAAIETAFDKVVTCDVTNIEKVKDKIMESGKPMKNESIRNKDYYYFSPSQTNLLKMEIAEKSSLQNSRACRIGERLGLTAKQVKNWFSRHRNVENRSGFTADQKRLLNQFLTDSIMSKRRAEEIASKTQLPIRSVCKWFARKRSYRGSQRMNEVLSSYQRKGTDQLSAADPTLGEMRAQEIAAELKLPTAAVCRGFVAENREK